MNDILFGIFLSFLIITFLEIFSGFDKKLVGTLILVGIAFIYVGFAWKDLFTLIITILFTLFFTIIAYFEYIRQRQKARRYTLTAMP